MSLELRKASDGTATISGLASRYGRWYDMRSFQERVMPGAARASLSRSPTILLRIDHEIPIARTPDSLKVWEDGDGLRYRAEVDTTNDADARTAVSRIDRGVYTDSSFAFRVPEGGDQWNGDFTERTIHSVDLDHGDVSVVAFGASPTTNTTVERALIGTLQERRAMAQKISGSGWFGPGLLRAANQYGAHSDCPTCGGSGDCQDCDGTGNGAWVSNDDSDDGGGRSAARVAPIRRRVPLAPRCDTDDALIRLALAEGTELARDARKGAVLVGLSQREDDRKHAKRAEAEFIRIHKPFSLPGDREWR